MRCEALCVCVVRAVVTGFFFFFLIKTAERVNMQRYSLQCVKHSFINTFFSLHIIYCSVFLFYICCFNREGNR